MTHDPAEAARRRSAITRPAWVEPTQLTFPEIVLTPYPYEGEGIDREAQAQSLIIDRASVKRDEGDAGEQ